LLVDLAIVTKISYEIITKKQQLTNTYTGRKKKLSNYWHKMQSNMSIVNVESVSSIAVFLLYAYNNKRANKRKK